jgi:ubiquinol-cytochrome c reductase cytochrome b subunit
MFAAILIILVLPFVDINKIKSSQFKPYNKLLVFSLVANFILLGVLGGCHPTNTVSFVGAIATGIYFSIFLFLIIGVSFIENTLSEISINFDEDNIK